MKKRVLDVILSIVFLIIFSPIFLIVALIIKLDSPGPVFFKQERLGLNGKSFHLYKFRSMYTDIVGHYSTSLNDPRITRFGKWIRKMSLDELPQLLNVVRGEMSLVGPRPNVINQRNEYTSEEWDLRNSVLPGITGLAQVKFRSLATPKERLEQDLMYVMKKSFFLDLLILFKTISCVFHNKGN
jgi:lipopolysaccharide/colanic/teichoic acid biosynthesis glycosyltransferase